MNIRLSHRCTILVASLRDDRGIEVDNSLSGRIRPTAVKKIQSTHFARCVESEDSGVDNVLLLTFDLGGFLHDSIKPHTQERTSWFVLKDGINVWLANSPPSSSTMDADLSM